MKRYELKESLQKGFINKKKFHFFNAMIISDMEVTNNSKGIKEIIPKGTIIRCRKFIEGFCYDAAVIQLAKDYEGSYMSFLGNYIFSEKDINSNMVITYLSSYGTYAGYKGIEIKKNFLTVYDSSKLFDYDHKFNGWYSNINEDYIEYVDGPLKELFQFDRIGANFFIEKTIPVLKDFVKALKKAENSNLAKNCILAMGEYLQTTLKTVSEFSEKTETEQIQIIKKQTETEKFLEDMKFRNEIIKEFHTC